MDTVFDVITRVAAAGSLALLLWGRVTRRKSMKRLLMALVAAPCVAFAQPYPSKPVRMIVPFPPGGQLDLIARIVQPKLHEFLGQPVLIENRGGAGGSVGAAEAARAVPDGHTVLMVFDTHATNHHVYESVPDPFSAFEHLMLLVTTPSLLVAAPNFGPKTLAEVLERAKREPRKVTYATPGSGSSNHLGMLALEQRAGVQMTHVTYKGGGPMVQALLGNEVDIAFVSIPLMLAHVQSSRVKAIAVGSKQRIAQLPNVPTLAESYPGFELKSWVGLVVPAGMPRHVAARIHRDMTRSLEVPEIRQRLADRGYAVLASSPDEFLAFVRSESDKLGKIIRDNKIQAE
jgi:tripartite-type tricarboxylate transporter receptor subunit TctC